MKIKYFSILFLIFSFMGTITFAQNKSIVDLVANDIDNIAIPEKLQIEFSFSSVDETKYKVKFIVKTITKNLAIIEKEYEYNVRSNNVEKDFKKESVINNIIYFFYLDEKKYSNAKEIRKGINKILESAIDDVKFDVERTKSNKEMEDMKKKGGN